MLPISVFVIARNEADRIGITLDSVRGWADEVIVVDSGSEDETVALAERLGARVVFNDWPGYGPQKIFAEGLCRNDWLLSLDADEAVGDDLRRSIERAFADLPPDVSAFRFHWTYVHFGDDRPRWLAPTGRFVRLYDRRRAGFRESIVHDSVVVREGRIADLEGTVHHRGFRSLEHHRSKLEAYREWQVKDMIARGRRPPAFRVVVEPLIAFVKNFVFRRYFIYGLDGWRMSSAYARIRRDRITGARAG